MNKFTIAVVILVVAVIGTFFFLEVPYENNYAAQMGDKVVFSYTVTDAEGNELASEGSERKQLVIGSDTMPQEFESQIIGMKRKDVKEITITYPADYYDMALQGQTRVYTVTMTDIEKCTGTLESCGATAENGRQNPSEESTEESTEE